MTLREPLSPIQAGTPEAVDQVVDQVVDLQRSSHQLTGTTCEVRLLHPCGLNVRLSLVRPVEPPEHCRDHDVVPETDEWMVCPGHRQRVLVVVLEEMIDDVAGMEPCRAARVE
jgi:hypothetical protein